MKHLASLSLALVAFTLPALGQTASGSITVNGKKASIEHVVAVHKDANVHFILSDKAVTAAQASDVFAMRDLGISGVEIEITPDGQITSGQIYSPALTKFGGSFSSVGQHKWEGKITKTSIEGKLSMPQDDFFDNKYEYTATFKAPIVSGPDPNAPPEIKGKPLPAGGGEPGKAYFAYLKVLKAGDVDKILASLVAERAKQTPKDQVKKMLPLIQEMVPKDIKYVSGGIDGDKATLNLTGTDHGSKSTGTVDMVKEGGVWKVEKESWSTKS